MNKKALSINLIFFAAIIISIFYIKQFVDNGKDQVQKNNDSSPDAYMINASYISTNEDGKRSVNLFSPYVTHYHQEDSSQFVKPTIEVYKNGETWLITAEKAHGLKGMNTFYLHNNVKVKQLRAELPAKARGSTKKTEGTTLITESLTVFPKRNLVETQDFVTILQSGLKVTAIGLKGDLEKGNIQLLSKTRGQYDPQVSK